MAKNFNHYDQYFRLNYKKSIGLDPKKYTEEEFTREFLQSDWYKNYQKFIDNLYPDHLFIDSSSYPNEPIDPKVLVERVVEQYLTSNDNIPDKTPQLITELCKGFNQAIQLNKNNQPIKNLVYAAQTGSAKSLTSQMYVALLENESTIIVVPRIDQAIETAKNINTWSNNSDYCRCYYIISQDNPHTPLRIDKNEISQHRCIIITHAMFIKVNEENRTEEFYYNNTPRDLVIVDERIILNKIITLTKFQLEELKKFFEWYYREKADQRIKELHLDRFLESSLLHDDLLEQISSNIYYYSGDERSHYGYTYTNEKIVQLANFIKSFSKSNLFYKDSKFFKHEEHQIKLKIIRTLESILVMMQNDYFYHKFGNNRTFITVVPVKNQFGSTVTLDATADINKYYHIAHSYGKSEIDLVETTRTKQYNNVNIHIANHFGQGRASIKRNSTYKKETPKYISLIDSLMKNKDDKILVITHKKFRTYLENYREDKKDKVFFTHWGNHVGKNDWNECNKVIIIGWNYYPDVEYYANFLKAAGSIEEAKFAHNNEENIKYKFKITQIADDLIQAINRIAIRKTIDEEGNCPVCDVYLFGNDTKEYKDIFKLIKFTFQNANFKSWNPYIHREKPQKKMAEKRAEELIKIIEDKLQQTPQVLRSEVVITSAIPKASASKIINGHYFQTQLTNHNIQAKGKHKAQSFEYIPS